VTHLPCIYSKFDAHLPVTLPLPLPHALVERGKEKGLGGVWTLPWPDLCMCGQRFYLTLLWRPFPGVVLGRGRETRVTLL